MPGIRIMNSSAASPQDADTRKRTFEGKLVNGQRTPSSAPPPTTSNGAVASIAGPPMPVNTMSGPPPKLEHQSPELYRPLSLLVERTAQETFNDLNTLLNQMSDLKVPHPPNGAMANGISGGQTDAELNRQKKLLVMNFAQTNRAKFIKLLVLKGWGDKYANDMTKLIDIWNWLMKENIATSSADERMDTIKNWTRDLGQKNPDIRTALEVLSTGKADWIPHMGFIPKDPVSPETGLKLLRHMDTALTIRLNVHETLPRHLQKWHVHDGRVTFTIDGEFEMDLITFSEDTSEQWWFIDLRLLFSPTPEIDEKSRSFFHLKRHLDHVLSQSPITAAYDFLHNFALTHKIAVLQDQAQQLARNAWLGGLKVTNVHRQLIVQYWVDRLGKKNWIEIGVTTNKPKNGKTSWHGPPISSLSARWFRQGVEVKDAKLDFDFTNLSMERILKKVIAMHVSSIIKGARDTVAADMKAVPKSSEVDPAECSLHVSLGRRDNSTTLSVEPVTGKILLQPQVQMTAAAEKYINGPQGTDVPLGQTLTRLLAQTLREKFARHALQVGWRPITTSPIRMDAIKQITKCEVLQFTLYNLNRWATNWVVGSVIDAAGESWWILKMSSEGTKIEFAEKLALQQAGPLPPVSRATLMAIERFAVQQIGFHVIKQELVLLKIPSRVSFESGAIQTADGTQTQPPAPQGWALHVQTSDLLRSRTGETDWIDHRLRIIVQGFTSHHSNISYIAFGSMSKSVAADMKKLMSASKQNNFIFSENGSFSILLSAPFGQPIATELTARLRDIDRLRTFAAILQKRKMRLSKSSLQAVQFQYGPENLSCVVSFKQNDQIEVNFNAHNPHNRIKKFLTEVINERPPYKASSDDQGSGLDRFCAILLFTRPILVTLAALETHTPDNFKNPAVFAHEIAKYRVAYENPLCSFDIVLACKDEKLFWLIRDNHAQEARDRPSAERNHKRLEKLKDALSKLFKSQGKGWYGLRDNLVAPVQPNPLGVQEALRRMQEVVLDCAVEGGYNHVFEHAPPEVKANAAPTASVPPAGPPQTQSQPQPQQQKPQQPQQPQAVPQGVPQGIQLPPAAPMQLKLPAGRGPPKGVQNTNQPQNQGQGQQQRQHPQQQQGQYRPGPNSNMQARPPGQQQQQQQQQRAQMQQLPQQRQMHLQQPPRRNFPNVGPQGQMPQQQHQQQQHQGGRGGGNGGGNGSGTGNGGNPIVLD